MSSRTTYSLETRKLAISRVMDHGIPASHVAQAMGIGKSTVKTWVAQACGRGRKRVRAQWTPEQDEEIVALRAEGLRNIEIAHRVGRTDRAVSVRLSHLQIAGREVGAPRKDGSSSYRPFTVFQTSKPSRRIWAYDRADAEAEAARQGLRIVTALEVVE